MNDTSIRNCPDHLLPQSGYTIKKYITYNLQRHVQV